MVEGGPQTDYTNLGQCQGTCINTPNHKSRIHPSFAFIYNENAIFEPHNR